MAHKLLGAYVKTGYRHLAEAREALDRAALRLNVSCDEREVMEHVRSAARSARSAAVALERRTSDERAVELAADVERLAYWLLWMVRAHDATTERLSAALDSAGYSFGGERAERLLELGPPR